MTLKKVLPAQFYEGSPKTRRKGVALQPPVHYGRWFFISL